MNYTTKYFDLSAGEDLFFCQVLTDFDALEAAPQIAAIRAIEGNRERGLFYYQLCDTISAFDLECGGQLESYLWERNEFGYSTDLTDQLHEALKCPPNFVWDLELMERFWTSKDLR